ncbi:MAG: hypothetical protein ACPKOI_10715 [Pleomorphochaeta sp.]
MKKKKVFLLFVVVIFVSKLLVFAETNTLQGENENIRIIVLGEVKKQNYVASLYYDDEKLENDLNILTNDNERFDISKAGRTNEFRIIIEGNQEIDSFLELKINGQKFIGMSGTETENIDTNLYVNAFSPEISDLNIPNYNYQFTKVINIPKGNHSFDENTIETNFILAWKGNERLPSGLYSSDIDIEYSVIK